MSNISQQRLIEMEAEMDRFEQEILSQPSASDLPRVVIGPNTYNQVSAQLKMLRAQSGMSLEERERKQREVANQLKALRAATERHVPSEEHDDSDDEGDEPDTYHIVGRREPPAKKPAIDPSLGMLPPPPPPPSLTTPSFVPPQLRKAPPPPPPARPPMGGPPRMRPPPPPPSGRHPYPGPGPMGPQGGPGYPPGPHPGMGPMGGPGPGPMRMHGPPGPHMGPPRPGFMQGPGPMPGPMHSGGMYGVSSGESYKEKEEAPEKVEEKPKVIYASAPVITVQREKKEKKKKKKKGDAGEESKTENEEKERKTTEIPAGPSLPKSLQTTSTSVPEPEDNLQVADMDIDGTAMTGKQKKEKKKKFVRMAAGKVWEDQSLQEWDPDDFRLFCGDLGNEVTDEVLARAFNKYSSFVKAKVVRDKRSNKTKGYGFVSFKDPNDYVRAMREMNGKYVGNRPIKLRKSAWKDRNIDIVKKKEKEKKRLGLK